MHPTTFNLSPWTIAHQAPLPIGVSRQEYWSELPWPPPGDLPNPGIQPRSPALQADSLLSEPPRKPPVWLLVFKSQETHVQCWRPRFCDEPSNAVIIEGSCQRCSHPGPMTPFPGYPWPGDTHQAGIRLHGSRLLLQFSFLAPAWRVPMKITIVPSN